jgi:hypothetical protein
MPERINIRKLRVTNQRFRLGFMPSKKDYIRSARIQKKKKKKNGLDYRERAR